MAEDISGLRAELGATNQLVGNVLAEVRADRATTDAYRAEVAAWRAQDRAWHERMELRFDQLDAEVGEIARKLMNGQ